MVGNPGYSSSTDEKDRLDHSSRLCISGIRLFAGSLRGKGQGEDAATVQGLDMRPARAHSPRADDPRRMMMMFIATRIEARMIIWNGQVINHHKL